MCCLSTHLDSAGASKPLNHACSHPVKVLQSKICTPAHHHVSPPPPLHPQVPSVNGQLGPGPALRPALSQTSMARHPSREQLIDYLMLKVSQQPGQPGPHGPPRMPQEALQEVSPGAPMPGGAC